VEYFVFSVSNTLGMSILSSSVEYVHLLGRQQYFISQSTVKQCNSRSFVCFQMVADVCVVSVSELSF